MNNLTEVTTVTTLIKMIDESDNDKVINHTAFGKLTITECKKLAKDLNLTYVSKEVVKESFEVDTAKLIELKDK